MLSNNKYVSVSVLAESKSQLPCIETSPLSSKDVNSIFLANDSDDFLYCSNSCAENETVIFLFSYLVNSDSSNLNSGTEFSALKES